MLLLTSTFWIMSNTRPYRNWMFQNQINLMAQRPTQNSTDSCRKRWSRKKVPRARLTKRIFLVPLTNSAWCRRAHLCKSLMSRQAQTWKRLRTWWMKTTSSQKEWYPSNSHMKYGFSFWLLRNAIRPWRYCGSMGWRSMCQRQESNPSIPPIARTREDRRKKRVHHPITMIMWLANLHRSRRQSSTSK